MENKIEENIKDLLKSNNREDIKLGILIAVKELGAEWCKKKFVESNYYYNPIEGAIAIRFRNGEYIFHNLFTEYVAHHHHNYTTYIEDFCDDVYEYNEEE